MEEFVNAGNGVWRQPLSSYSLRVLALGFQRPAVNPLSLVRFTCRRRPNGGGDPETSRKTQKQRTHDSYSQCISPAVLASSIKMSQVLHFAYRSSSNRYLTTDETHTIL